MKDKRTFGSWRTALECLLASLALAVLTFVSFRLHAGPAMAALLFFFLVALISLWAGFLSTVFACAVAALCFDYFFTQPPFRLRMSDPVEIAALIAFTSTALIVSRLVARVRARTTELQRTNEQLQSEIAERKRAEEGVRQKEEELRQLIDAIPQQVFVFDANWNPLFANQREREYTGLTREEAQSNDALARVFHPEDLKKLEVSRERMRSGGAPSEMEARIRGKDGQYRWFLIRDNPLRDEQGRVLRWYGTRTDIEDRKRAEEALHRLNRELRALSECNQTLMRAIDEPTLLQKICRIVCEEAGYRVAWVGYAEHDEAKSVRPVAWTGTEEGDVANLGITWADTERGRGIIGTAIRSGKTCCIKDYATDPEVAPWREGALQHGFRSAIALPLKDEHANIFGSLNIYSAQPNAFTSEEIRLLEELAGDLAFGIVTLRSRAARERAEQKLRQQEMELRQVLDLTPLLVTEFGPDRERLYANRPTLDYVGVTLEEWQSIADRFWFYHPDDRKRLARDVYTGPGSEVPHEFEARFRKGDGTYRWFLFRDNPVRDEQGRITRWYFSATDIEDRKRAEEERRARVWFLESMDRVNRAIGGTNDLEQMTGDVINAMLSIFASDRAFLYYPCDPDAPSFEVFMERTRPEYPGARGVIPMTPETARGFQIVRASSSVVTFGPGCDYPLIGDFAQRFGHQSSMGITLYPKTGQPWVLAMQQCAYPRAWTADERKLLEEIARRLTDALTSLLMFRSLRESEEALRRSEAYLTSAQRLTSTGSWALDGTTRMSLYWSDETFRIWGFDPQQGLPTWEQIVQRIHPQDLQTYQEAAERAILKKEYFDLEYRIVLPDATVKHLHTLAHSVLSPAGEVLELVGTTVDITERKRAEEALWRSEAYLASAQKLTRTGTYAMNGTSRELIYWSEEILRLFGTDRKEGLLTRDQRWERIHPEDHDKVKEASDRVFLEKVDSEVEYRIVLPDGAVKLVHTQAHPVLSASGEVAEVVATMVDITERKRAEEALRAQAALLDLTHDTVFVMDMEGVIQYWNRGAEERYGWTAEQALGRVVHDLLKTVFPGPLEEIRAEVSRAGRWEGEIRHTKKDGTPVVVASRWALQRDERGAPVAILETNNDITLRKRAEEALRLSNAYNRSLIEASPDPLVTIGPDGEITDVNAATEAATGRSRGELVGTDFCHYFTDPAKARAGYEQVFREGMVRDYPLELRHRDGGVMSVLYNASVYRDESGRVTGVFAAARDITERQRAQEALRRSEAYLAEGQRLSHTGSWAFELASNKYIYVSEEIFRIFEMDAQEGLPNREAISRLIHPEDWDRVNEDFEKSLREKVDASSEFRIVLPSGTVKHLQATRHPVLNDAGDVVELVGTVIDMTERKRAEQERERLRQLESELAHIDRISMMGELAASIAHEINQPLSGVVVNANACLRWLAGDSPNLVEARETVRRIVRDGKRAGEVIARIRALTTKAPAAKERLDLNEAIREVAAFVGDELSKNRVAVRTEFAPDLLPVLGDRVQLQQVVLNLVMNGIQAMSSVEERPRELIVRTQNDEAGQVRVSVQDSGIGLDPQSMERMFDAFYTTKHGGMGMGLSISRSIIENHGGKLWAVANDGPGISVQFTIPKYQ